MPYEDILNEIAQTNFGPLVYPTPEQTIEDQITAKVQEINDLINEVTVRPSPKSAYLAKLEQLNQEKDELIIKNEQIIANNLTATQTAVVDYNSLIEKEKLNPEVIAEATRRAFEENYKDRLAAIELALLELGEKIL